MPRTHLHPTVRLVVLATTLALTSACSEDAPASGGGEAPVSAAGATGPSELLPPGPPRLLFTEQAAAAGIDYVNWCGSERDTKVTILESIGQGAAWLDDDGDGVLDLFLVNGSSLGPLPTDRAGE